MAYLRERGYDAHQFDLGIELLDRIFSRNFLEQLFATAFECETLSRDAQAIVAQKQLYLNSVEAVMGFLRGSDSTLGVRIVGDTFLPRGPRFCAVSDEDMEWAFGVAGIADRAKYLCTLYLEDVMDLISEVVAPGFSLVKYGEQLAVAASTFDELLDEVERENNLIEQMACDLLIQHIDMLEVGGERCEWVGFSIPFPGCMLSALKCGKMLRSDGNDGRKVVFGGGYVSTELRSIRDPRIFDYVDYMVFDDGELPLDRLFGAGELLRTIYLTPAGDVSPLVDCVENVGFASLPAPCFTGLPVAKYFSTITLTNPMHKLWSDGMWNKMTVAHGCYWAKCTFCDTHLDYICRYEAPSAKVVVDRMESIISQTGSSGFHFTDEALPPKLLREISLEILERGLVVSFWGNIRFERNFDAELCALLAKAGCVAVSGGIEVASARLLKLINKGITLDGLRGTLECFADAGIMVHGYLMYAFPTQTFRETVDSLEVVRSFFADGLLQSAFWHRFAMTVHSDVGCDPERFGVRRLDDSANGGSNLFANNAVEFTHITPAITTNNIDHSIDSREDVDWEFVGAALSRATYNYMNFTGLDIKVSKWFR